MKKGIDVSKHNGNINWNKVNVDFAILRAGYGNSVSQKDAKFEANYAGAKKAGIPIGAYWYSYAKTEADAKKEAEACLAILKGKQFEYPIYYDIEEKGSLAVANKIARVFCDILEKAGYYVGIYCSTSHLLTYFSDEIRRRYTIWVAQWRVSKPSYSGTYDIWQYSDSGRINGISGNVDMDYCYLDFPSIIKKVGLNGFSKTPTNTVKNDSYIVQAGDTLTSIAKKYDMTVDEIVAKNNLIKEGQKLIV